MATRIYPDASIALRYRALKEIDWRTLAGDQDVVLVLISQFIREIDKQKDQGRGQLQKRARRVSAWLRELRSTKILDLSSGVRVEINPSEPETATDFAKEGLAPEVADDKFIGCMVRDSRHHSTDTTACVTADTLLALKAEALGFKVIELPEELELEDEPDETEKQFADLRKQLADLKAGRAPEPKLALSFEGGQAHATIPIKVLAPLTKRAISDNVLDEEEAFDSLAHHLGNSTNDKRRYITQLAAWLHEYSSAEVAKGLTAKLWLSLWNKGDGNATNIDVTLTFPEYIRVARKRPIEGPGKRPASPLGLGAVDQLHKMLAAPTFPRTSALDELIAPVADNMKVSAERPNVAKFRINSLRHKDHVDLRRFDVWFESASQVSGSGFSIKYEIHANEGKETETLHVKLEKSEGAVVCPP
jgi:PIN domain